MTMTMPTMPAWTSDRREAIERPVDAKVTVLVPGVELCPLVGAHNGARNLFTGLLTLAPKATYPVYTRPFAEALVLITGDVAMDVENRRYRPGLVDAIIVPTGLSRRVVNLSVSRPAVIHVAMPSPTPEQTWVNARFTPVDQPAGSTGHAGAERLCRNRPADRFELAPKALFQDLYNAELGTTGICGGHGVFEPGARLPCHRHEFDESITIVQGMATCVVEGQRYELSERATALVPQGRCHYFINLTLEPMAMLWVYAGDKPDRIVMDETYCHPEKATGTRGPLQGGISKDR
jgi:mannose-6-phosphate isomerase-like protein (cupin superfamily)